MNIEILQGIGRAIYTHRGLPGLLQAAMDQIEPMLDPKDFGVLLLWDPGEGVFTARAAVGGAFADKERLEGLSLQRSEGITGKVYDLGQPRYLGSSGEISEWMGNMTPINRASIAQTFGNEFQPRTIAALPLQTSEQKFGVLLLGSQQDTPALSEHDLPFLATIADLISLAIDRVRLEEDLSAAQEAQFSGRMSAEALATLSHELRTPLAAIKGYSTALLLEDIDWPDEKRIEFLKLIDGECDDLETMIIDILDSSLIDVGQLTLELQPVRLERLAREVADDMRNRVELHRLVVDFPKNFPILDADHRRIKQVMRNILDNAVKYSPNGDLVVIRGELRRSDAVVSISDQGVGISPEDLIPLFDRYFRVKSPTGYYVPGTGLGLPVARAIVEAHGGRIWAESKVGEGTTLSFSLPLPETRQKEGLRSSSSESSS